MSKNKKQTRIGLLLTPLIVGISIGIGVLGRSYLVGIGAFLGLVSLFLIFGTKEDRTLSRGGRVAYGFAILALGGAFVYLSL